MVRYVSWSVYLFLFVFKREKEESWSLVEMEMGEDLEGVKRGKRHN